MWIGISWRGIGTGVAVFVVWAAVAHFVTTPAAMPETLARLPGTARDAWLGCRAAAAIITVPIAEELAYRGFLMRRIVNEAFESVPLQAVRWPAVAIERGRVWHHARQSVGPGDRRGNRVWCGGRQDRENRRVRRRSRDD